MDQNELILNRYRPLDELGRGGFGTVLLAWDTRIQRRVAIKCMPLDDRANDRISPESSWSEMPWLDAAQAVSSTDSACIEEELRAKECTIPGLEEARTAAMLQAPTIAGVFDFVVRGSYAFLIMEYVDGITLTQLLHDWGDYLDPDIVAAIFSGVADALSQAHENAVLHLDVKPDNILINHQGMVKVTDFGLATLSHTQGFGSAAGGTIGYMPPEQMDCADLDERCDEWALASVVYEMIAEENPFRAKNIASAKRAIANAELVLPHLCMPELDPEVDEVLFFALDPDRDERYQTVSDFADVLLPLLGDVRAGTHRLAAIVEQATNDEDDRDTAPAHVPLIERLSARGKHVGMRFWSAVGAGVVSYLSLQAMPHISAAGGFAFWGLFALIVLVTLIVPHLGIMLALGAFAIALFLHAAYIPAIALIFAAFVWWVVVT